jgi:Domain of unknown function (DUF4034)
MTARIRLSFVFILGVVSLLSSCGQLRVLADRAQRADRLIEVARAYSQAVQSAAAPSVSPTTAKPMSPAFSSTDGTDQEAEYKNQIMMDLVHKDYDALDKAAHEDRSPTARIGGGSWRVWGYYDGLDNPPTGENATDDDWNAQIDALKAWVAARPESGAARIALASAYDRYGSKARGSGYADSVSAEGWRLYYQRADMAASTLVEAAKLKDRSPYWYSVMFDVALAQGWTKPQAKELLDAAIAFEPSYYHAYRQYVNFILPKWYGQEGDAQTFAEQISGQLGGQQGKFVYFEIASTVVCGCDSNDDAAMLETLSWPKIKEGYTVLGQLYGYSSLKANRFAYMAVLEHDKPAAQAAFASIGDNWNKDVWHSRPNFLNAKAWAEGQQGQ